MEKTEKTPKIVKKTYRDAFSKPYIEGLLQCRLCLREYDSTQLVEIFDQDSNFAPEIFTAVAVKPYHQDRLTCICLICKDIVHLINCFKTACQRSNIMLNTNELCVLQTGTWSSFDGNGVFKEARFLAEKHQQEMEKVFNGEPVDESEPELDVSDSDESVQFIGETVGEFSTAEGLNDLIVKSSEGFEEYLDEMRVKKQKQRKPTKPKPKPPKKEKTVCTTCGELVCHEGFEGHMNRHLGVQPFACQVEGCGAKLYSKSALRQHHSHHRTNNKYYDCTTCGKRIKGTSGYLVHRKRHTEEPKYPCDICGKKFRSKYILQMHAPVHTGIAEFPCDICGKYFTVRHNRNAHYRTHFKTETKPAKLELVLNDV